MTYDATKWGDLFPATIGNEARPTDAIDNTLDFATNAFPQFIANDPVKYTLQNAFLKQLFSNDQRIKEITDNIKKGYVPLSGGTITGALTLSGAPTADLHAATKKYVDGLTAVMVGATANANGDIGEVPKPTKGQQNNIFTGNGAWTGLADLLKAFGMKYSLTDNGYIDFGSVFGGLIIQWAPVISNGSGARTVTVPLSFAFPNACLRSWAIDDGAGCYSLGCSQASLSAINVYIPQYQAGSGSLVLTSDFGGQVFAIGY